jgi:hypothetical protein
VQPRTGNGKSRKDYSRRQLRATLRWHARCVDVQSRSQVPAMVESNSAPSGYSGEVERAVMGYLRAHPDAADTLDGVVGWWLPQQRYETERMRIEAALRVLVARGLLRRSGLPGGTELYALNDVTTAPPH